MNIKQNNPLTNFYRPTGIPNKINSNSDNANNVQNSAVDTMPSRSTPIRFRMPTEDMLYGGGNPGIPYFELRYAENSTDENPIMIAKGWENNGNEFTQTININDIDPRNLTAVELKMLQVQANGGNFVDLTTDPATSTIGYEHELMGTDGKLLHEMGLHDRFDPIASLQTVKDIYSGWNFAGIQDSIKDISALIDKLSKFEKSSSTDNVQKPTKNISALIDKLSKFEKNGTKNINTVSNSVDDFIDDITTSMVNQYSKSSQAKKD